MVFTVPKTRPAYPDEFRREAVQMLRAGRTARELAQSLGVSEQTLRNWRRQAQVDRRARARPREEDVMEILEALMEEVRLVQRVERALNARELDAYLVAQRRVRADRIPVAIPLEVRRPERRRDRRVRVEHPTLKRAAVDPVE